MKSKIEKWKRRLSRLMLAAMIFQISAGQLQAAPTAINTGDIDLTVLASIAASITGTPSLVKWRTGVGNQIPVAATALTFSTYLTGPNLAPVSKTNPADNTANAQGDIWSDNAIKLDYVKPNSLATAILVYSSNSVTDAQDPLGNVSLRGGLVGCSSAYNTTVTPETCPVADDPARTSVIPLLWKAVGESDLVAVSTASVTNKVAATSPLFMYTEITPQNGGACPSEGTNTVPPLTALPTRANNGFCDFSTHYFVDRNNTDPTHKFYDQYASGSPARNNAFNYSSLVGPYGANTTEQGLGAGLFNPPGRMYAVLGVTMANALQVHYGTTVYVEVMTR